jgi:deazaflavin-dependent oxidoreductase (nitroreductase family)
LNRILRSVFRTPVYLYRWHCGWLLGHRFLLLRHTGRRTGKRHATVLEVLEYRKESREAVVMSGFGRDASWLRNLQATPVAERQRFAAAYRFLDEAEAVAVLASNERRNRVVLPLVRRVLSRLLGWRYHGSEHDRRRLVAQLPLIALRPR